LGSSLKKSSVVLDERKVKLKKMRKTRKEAEKESTYSPSATIDPTSPNPC
jgi:hypothetical protein